MAIIKYHDIVEDQGLNVPGENNAVLPGVETTLVNYTVPAGTWNITGFVVTGDVDCEAVLEVNGQRHTFARTSSSNRTANPMLLGGAVKAETGHLVRLLVTQHESSAQALRGNVFGFTRGV